MRESFHAMRFSHPVFNASLRVRTELSAPQATRTVPRGICIGAGCCPRGPSRSTLPSSGRRARRHSVHQYVSLRILVGVCFESGRRHRVYEYSSVCTIESVLEKPPVRRARVRWNDRSCLNQTHWKRIPLKKETANRGVLWTTGLDAVRKMMQGGATGKSLNVKGKSAKEGVLSGFVPFLQIYDESHKRLIGASLDSISKTPGVFVSRVSSSVALEKRESCISK